MKLEIVTQPDPQQLSPASIAKPMTSPAVALNVVVPLWLPEIFGSESINASPLMK